VWLDDFFRSYYRHRPVNATFIGVHDYDDRLPDFSENGSGDLLAETESLLDRLRALPSEPASEAEALDRRLAEGFLEIQRWELGSKHFHRGNPCVYTGEAIFGVLALFLREFAPLVPRVESATARLEAIPSFLARARANLREAPPAWTERAIKECRGALAFLERGVHLLGMEPPTFRSSVEKAIVAFYDFQRYLEGELRQRLSKDYACGAEALELLLRKGHFLDRDAASIEGYARERLAHWGAELAAKGGRSALERLEDHHPPLEQYYSRYQEVWSAAREVALAHDLVSWPEAPIRYVPQPQWAREAAPYLYFLYYRSPAPFDRLPLTDYLVTPIEPEFPRDTRERLLRAHNDSVIKLNHVVHHGGLGHHVQNQFAYRAASRLGQMAAVDCASRIALFCGGTMAEGWACYATDLMDEIGFLTPFESLAEIHSRMRMAARAIVDVRLHQGVFDLDEAAAFYQERVGMTPKAAQGEAVKNSMFPGTGLMYLMGCDLIHQLRRDLAAREGSAFSLRRFHDRFLSYGSVPVSLAAAAMKGLERI